MSKWKNEIEAREEIKSLGKRPAAAVDGAGVARPDRCDLCKRQQSV